MGSCFTLHSSFACVESLVPSGIGTVITLGDQLREFIGIPCRGWPTRLDQWVVKKRLLTTFGLTLFSTRRTRNYLLFFHSVLHGLRGLLTSIGSKYLPAKPRLGEGGAPKFM